MTRQAFLLKNKTRGKKVQSAVTQKEAREKKTGRLQKYGLAGGKKKAKARGC